MNIFKYKMNNIDLINPVIYRKRREMSFNKTIFLFFILLIFCIYLNIIGDIRELKLYYNNTYLKSTFEYP